MGREVFSIRFHALWSRTRSPGFHKDFKTGCRFSSATRTSSSRVSRRYSDYRQLWSRDTKGGQNGSGLIWIFGLRDPTRKIRNRTVPISWIYRACRWCKRDVVYPSIRKKRKSFGTVQQSLQVKDIDAEGISFSFGYTELGISIGGVRLRSYRNLQAFYTRQVHLGKVIRPLTLLERPSLT